MQLTKRQAIAAIGIVAVLAVALTVLLTRGEREAVLSATQRTTTTLAPTTTTIPGTHAEVTAAAAIGPEVVVLAEHPDGAPLTAGSEVDWAADLPEIDLAGMPPIPRDDLISEGVRTVPEGWAYDNPTYFGNTLTLLVLAEEGEWLEVLLPARPNGQTGWVHRDDVELSTHDALIEIAVGERMLRAWVDGEKIAETEVVVGTDSTPTPIGTFYLTEKIPRSNPGGAYGPWILPTNGYSEAMNFFDGGLPVIALHGTNAPHLLGSAASNGCIRVPNEIIERLAFAIPEGTPIQIVP